MLAAGSAALVGALVWWLLASQGYRQYSLIAWPFGLLVGLVAQGFGARGRRAAARTATIALVGILGGKLLVANSLRPLVTDRILQMPDVSWMYDRLEKDARAFSESKPSSDKELREFMVARGYASDVDSIGSPQLDQFKAEHLPRLNDWVADPPSFDAWEAEWRAQFEEMVGSVVTTPSIFRDLTRPIDALFIVLGVATAFGIVIANGPSRRSRRRELSIESEAGEGDGQT